MPPTGLIPWFSKNEGNTYAALLHHPFLFKGKLTQCSRGSKKDFWRRCRGDLRQVKSSQDLVSRQRAISGAVAGESTHKSRHTKYPSQTRLPRTYIICHLPLVFLSPTSPLPFYSPSLSVRLFFACFLFARVLDCLLVTMALPRFGDLHLKRLEEIKSNIRSFMVLQFEHNNFFRKELKEQKNYGVYEQRA